MKSIFIVVSIFIVLSCCNILEPQRVTLGEIDDHGVGGFRALTVQDLEIKSLTRQLEHQELLGLRRRDIKEKLLELKELVSRCHHRNCNDDCCLPPPMSDKSCWSISPLNGDSMLTVFSYDKNPLTSIIFINSKTNEELTRHTVDIPNTKWGRKLDFSDLINSGNCYNKAIVIRLNGESFELF